MKNKVYLETTVISYLTARPSKDPIVLGHQEVTKRWWKVIPGKYEIVVSEVVIEEAEAGDALVANERLEAIQNFSVLRLTDDVSERARKYLNVLPIPEKAFGDVLHLSFCSVFKIDYLVTWNCRHLANVEMIKALRYVNEGDGWHTPIICTPDFFVEV